MNILNSQFSRSFPLPKSLSFDPVALEISSDTVRILKLKESKFGLIPDLYKEIKLKNRVDLSDPNIKPDEIKEVKDQLITLRKEFNLKYVVATLPEQKTYIYQSEFPREVESDLGSAIRLNLEENVPLNVKDVNFSYKVTHADENQIEVIVSVFPKDIIKIYTDLLKNAGLFPLAFQGESEAVSNSVVSENEDRPIMVIRMAENHVNVSIVEHGVVHYASKISLNCCNLDTAINSQEMNTLSQELNKTLIYWFTNKKGVSDARKIENAILVGHVAELEGMVEYLENSLKIDVELGIVWTNCFSTDDYIPELTMTESLDYSATVGLALKAIKYD